MVLEMMVVSGLRRVLTTFVQFTSCNIVMMRYPDLT